MSFKTESWDKKSSNKKIGRGTPKTSEQNTENLETLARKIKKLNERIITLENIIKRPRLIYGNIIAGPNGKGTI